jgi:hypothetical protein
MNMNTNQLRDGMFSIARVILEQFSENKSIISNIFGMDGMGKTSFINQIMPAKLKAQSIGHKILSVSSNSDVSQLALELLEWVTNNLLAQDMKINLGSLGNDLNHIENAFSKFDHDIHKQKNRTPFTILIDDLDNLPFDDLDWFQSVVIESLSAISHSAIIITSHNELTWHSWELRNRCQRIRLECFNLEEINKICPKESFAQKIYQLSAGHPGTVEALVKIVSKKYQVLAQLSQVELKQLNDDLLKGLKEQIERNLTRRTEVKWLREVFWLIAAADGFDADLINEVINGKGIKIPDEVTDIAWEMAYTGLVTWNFEEKTYKMSPELRERIIQYNLECKKDEYTRVLKVLVKSFKERSQVLPNPKEQIAFSRKYLLEIKDVENAQTVKLSSRARMPVSTNTNSLSSQMGGTMRNLPKTLSSEKIVPRKKEEEIFRNLISGNLKKSILCIRGDAGLGKTVLLKRFQDLAITKKYPVILVDLHYRRNRRPTVFLQEIIFQLNLKGQEIETIKKKLSSPRDYFSAVSAIDAYEHVAEEAITAIASKFHALLKKRKQRIVILIDTFDLGSSITYFSNWLFSRLLPQLENTFYLVIAGRRNFSQELKSSQHDDAEVIEIRGLKSPEIKNIISLFRKKDFVSSQVRNKLINLSAGNPLIASWIMFYLTQIRDSDKDVFTWYDSDNALDDIAKNTWASSDKSAVAHAFLAATHFGSHFSYNLFENVVPKSNLGNFAHSRVLDYIREHFPVYGRSTQLSWTLHDEVRRRMLQNLKKNRINRDSYEASLQKLSLNAINYYETEISRLEGQKKKTGLTPDEQADYYDYNSERIYHSIFSKSENYHLELWNYLDGLWHEYRLEEMAQVIQYGYEVQERNDNAKKDNLLTNLLNGANAWLHYAREEFDQAEKLANLVLKSNPPHRLEATARVVLGRLPYASPAVATKNLEVAYRLYKRLLQSLRANKLSEFCDSEKDLLQEMHMVLIQIGRMHLLHYFNLDDGMKSLKQAYTIATSKEWNNLLYAAIALNEIARYQRFRGQFNDALDNITQAIAIYQKKGISPSSRANLANFYTTLGLIKKEKGNLHGSLIEFKKAVDIYANIAGLSETHVSTVFLELGHVYTLLNQPELAEPFLIKAHEVFKVRKETHRWFYLNCLNKLGELYKIRNPSKAKKYFLMEKSFAEQRGYDLWAYWANYYLAEINFTETGKVNKNDLDKLILTYDEKLKRDLGPAFWLTKSLMFKYYIKKGEVGSAFLEYAKGLTYLVSNWGFLFEKNLDLLQEEFLGIEVEKRVSAAKAVKEFWNKKYKKRNPSPRLIKICEQIINLES